MVWTRETSRLVALIVRHPSLRSVSSRIPLSGSSGEESGATDPARFAAARNSARFTVTFIAIPPTYPFCSIAL